MTWQRHREATGHDPLIHLSLARIPPVRSGVIGLFSQNLILMGTFFVVPLYLQLVLGLTPSKPGSRCCPSRSPCSSPPALGARLSNRFPVRSIVRTGLLVTIAGVLILLATIQPTLSDAGFAIGMAVLGVGMGLMISQLGNVIQSSVEESGRSEAGGLQFTGQQLGSALGVAFIGAIVLTGLTSTFISTVEHDTRISAEVSTQVGVAAGSNTNFVLLQPSGDRRTTRRARPGHHRRAGRRLRDRPAPLPQSRPPRRGPPGPHLPRLHPRATPRPTPPPRSATPRKRNRPDHS